MENREAWLEERKLGVGGSDIPVLFGDVTGETTYKSITELCLDKIGKLPPVEENYHMRRGRLMEGFVRHEYSRVTDRFVEIPKPFVWAGGDYLRGNVDGIIYETMEFLSNHENGGVLEIKCPSMAVFNRIKREGIPLAYQLQLQHYLLVTGYAWGSFGIWSAEYAEMIPVVDVEADLDIHAEIIERATKFWGHVERREPLPDDTPPPPETKLPEIGASDKVVKVEGEEWQRLIGTEAEAKMVRKEAEEFHNMAKAETAEKMAEIGADVVEGFGRTVYNREQAGRKTRDDKALQAAHPDVILSDFMKQGKSFRTFKSYPLREKSE